MTRPNRRWLIVCGLGFSLTATIGYASYLLSQERKKDEALAKELITEFHRHYNSDEVDSSSEFGVLIAERMKTERGRLGRFASVRHCIVKRIAEPPYLEADCLSSFQNGDVEEFFIMHHATNDSHLLSYSAKSHGQEVSIP